MCQIRYRFINVFNTLEKSQPMEVSVVGSAFSAIISIILRDKVKKDSTSMTCVTTGRVFHGVIIIWSSRDSILKYWLCRIKRKTQSFGKALKIRMDQKNELSVELIHKEIAIDYLVKANPEVVEVHQSKTVAVEHKI
jgi:hypothetical protein